MPEVQELSFGRGPPNPRPNNPKVGDRDCRRDAGGVRVFDGTEGVLSEGFCMECSFGRAANEVDCILIGRILIRTRTNV